MSCHATAPTSIGGRRRCLSAYSAWSSCSSMALSKTSKGRLPSFRHTTSETWICKQGSLRAATCTLLACSWPCFRLLLLGGTAAINKQSILCSPRVTNIAVTTLSIHRPSDTALGPFTLWRRPRQVKTAVVPDRRPPSTLSCRWTAGKISIPACAMMHTRSPTGISRLCRRRRPLVSCCTLPCRRSQARRMQVAGC
jgi:hypothetical protein